MKKHLTAAVVIIGSICAFLTWLSIGHLTVGCGGGVIENDLEKAKPVVLSVTKTLDPSPSFANVGNITYTLIMSKAISVAPSITVETTVNADISAATVEPESLPCSIGEDKITVTCSYDKVTSCLGLQEYDVTIQGALDAEGHAMDPFSARFNSADDDFDVDSVGVCWIFTAIMFATPVVENGYLYFNITANPEETEEINIFKELLATNYAMTMHIAENTVPPDLPADSLGMVGFSMNPSFADINERYCAFFNGFFNQNQTLDMTLYLGILAYTTKTDDANFTVYAPDESWGDTTNDLYLCAVRFGNALDLYASKDGQSFTQFSPSNTIMAMSENPADPTPLDFPYDSHILSALRIFVSNPNLLAYTPKIDFVRFNSSGVEGTASDCPTK